MIWYKRKVELSFEEESWIGTEKIKKKRMLVGQTVPSLKRRCTVHLAVVLLNKEKAIGLDGFTIVVYEKY